MAIETFGITPATVRAEYFTGLDPFDTSTNPTADTVTAVITKQAAILQGRLALENISAATIGVDDESAAYSMLGDILGRMVAMAIAQNMTGADSTLLERWQDGITGWFAALNSGGGAFLGDQSLQAGAQADGPTTHMNYFGLVETSPITRSSVDPFFKRDDKL